MSTSKKSHSDDAPLLTEKEARRLKREGKLKVVRNNGNMVKVLRAKLALSQSQFAEKYQLNLRTIQDWEQGRYEPDQIARNYLQVISKHPKVVAKAVST